jgi:hypothetical protein
MSKRINVNPDHYKVAGRERQGENIVHALERQAFAAQQGEAVRWQARQEQQRPSWTHPTQPLAEKKPARAKSRRPAATPRPAARKTKPDGRPSQSKRAQPTRKTAAKKRRAASTARPRAVRRPRRRS